MSYDTLPATVPYAFGKGQEIVFSYPSGRTADDYRSEGAILSVGSDNLRQGTEAFFVTYGPSNIRVYYNGPYQSSGVVTLKAPLSVEADVISGMSSSGAVFSVDAYSTVLDADAAVSINRVIDLAAAAGGGIVELSAKTYSRNGAAYTTPIQLKSNIHIRGAGIDKTIISFNDIGAVSWAHCFNGGSEGSRLSNVKITDLTVKGKRDVDLTGGRHNFTLEYIDGLHIENVKSAYSRLFGLSIAYCTNVTVTRCIVERSRGDGIAVWHSAFASITDNKLRWIYDDCISCHTDDATAAPLRQNLVITGNQFWDSQGIKVLGAKACVIAHNIGQRVFASGIYVKADTGYNQGSTPMHSIVIEGNIINDLFTKPEFGDSGHNYIGLSKVTSHPGALTSPPGEPDSATGVFRSFYGTGLGTFQVNNVDDAAVASPGSHFFLVRGNICARTLPAVDKYSDWGYGTLSTNTGEYDGPITEANLSNANGILIQEGIQNTLITDNVFSGYSDGILLTQAQDLTRRQFKKLVIRGNIFHNLKGGGIVHSCASLVPGDITVENNEFDLDPFYAHASRGAGGTWATVNDLVAIYFFRLLGSVVRNNNFRNCSSPISVASVENALTSGNVIFADPATPGFSASNKGVGEARRPGTGWQYQVLECDPTQATFGQLKNTMVAESFQQPTTGTYLQGHFVKNTSPSVAGTAGSQYVIHGWLRMTNGSAHVAGTDWIATRTLTGT